jgi:hypothetical protein
MLSPLLLLSTTLTGWTAEMKEADYLGHIPCPECARKGDPVIPSGMELLSLQRVYIAMAGTGLVSFAAGLIIGFLLRRKR